MVTRRRATEADREFVRAVHRRAYRDVVERQYGLWDQAVQDRFFDTAWCAASHEIILSEEVPCGYCCVEQQADQILIQELVIDPDYQRKGIGTQLLHGILSAARMRRVPVRLQTQVVNRAADLYRRLGFRETGRTATHIQMEYT
jgi:ribosomal protein S18 acetylase RimI-like enzyme